MSGSSQAACAGEDGNTVEMLKHLDLRDDKLDDVVVGRYVDVKQFESQTR